MINRVRSGHQLRGTHLAIMLCVLAAALPQVARAQDTVGRTVTLPNVRGEPEPGTTFVANWTAVEAGLNDLLNRPRRDDAAVIEEVKAMGDAAPPPYLMEMGRRIAATDPVEGAYWFRLGYLRTQWAAFACADTTARQASIVVLTALENAEQGLVERFDQPELRLPAYERLGDGDAVFQSTASAWWICSHGMLAMTAGLQASRGESRTIPLSVWLAPEATRASMQARLRAYLPQWAADDRAALTDADR